MSRKAGDWIVRKETFLKFFIGTFAIGVILHSQPLQADRGDTASLTRSLAQVTRELNSLGLGTPAPSCSDGATPRGVRGTAGQTAAIYGEDNRTEIPDFNSSYPYSTIGFLNHTDRTLQRRFSCTATLISPCHILTAAHCVRNFGSAEFHKGGIAYGVTGIELSPESKDGTRSDWAVLQVWGNPGKKLGFMKLKKMSGTALLEKTLILAGYSRDRSGLSVDNQVKVIDTGSDGLFGRGQNLIYFLANSFYDSSGAALWHLNEKNEPILVGVNIMGKVGPDSTQIHLPPKEQITSYKDAASGVASEEFFNQVTSFIEKSECPSFSY